MDAFVQPLYNLADFDEIEKQIQKQGIVQVSGCLDSQKAHFANGLAREFPFRLIIVENDLKAKVFYEDYRLYDPEVLLYPARDLIFYQADIHGNLITRQRLQVLKALLENDEVTVIASMDSCLDYLIPLELWKSKVLHFKNDSEIDLDKMKNELVELGYERTGQVEVPGQFSIRGGIMDIFPLTEENPWRIELWGDEIDSIRSFDAQSQRSIENLEQISIYPATEMILDKDSIARGMKAIEKEAKSFYKKLRDEFKTEEAARVRHLADEVKDQIQEFQHFTGAENFIHYFYKTTVSFLDYFPEDTLVVIDEPNRLTEHAKATEEEFHESMIHRLEKGYLLPGQMNLICRHQDIVHRLHSRHTLSLSTMEPRGNEWNFQKELQLTVKSVNPYNNSFEMLLKDLKHWKKMGYQVLLLSPSRTRAARLAANLQEEGMNAYYSEDIQRLISPGEIKVSCGHVTRGFEYPLIKYVVISETDIFGKEKKKKRKKSEYSGKKIQSFAELSVGDFVVHENHGLGVYKGIEKMEVDGVVKDYIKIEYAGKSNLYILATQLDMLQKYAGADAKPPKLNKLGGQEWNKTKTRVRGAVKNIAKDLVALYAARQNESGFIYGPDTVWQREFEEMFPFEETEDQLLAIEAAKRDMESHKIMDRLICGDVGYGKTEIALRVAFKAIQEGKQVVYLVPTTILAQQHYNTFTQRMKEFPVRVDLMCRFCTPSQQKKTLADLKKGLVDIVIGTHRVLSADVKFKDLGLLIIDEEQRFGVTHKEKIKQMKKNVDVLTLTATPIPRTLHMSLIGIRDMSVLEEPPQDRMPIQTYVMEYNDEMVREAISREMARDGQVYYVYNRVNNIEEVTNQIAKLVPEANVAYAHGQMSERELEKIMYGFINGDIDVLVSTTIIETGLDISNVNTMIIHDADQLGLSQLYQLRGRVGRSNRTAYAFLMYRRNKMLKEIAEKRLHAIREFTELGSGIKIAMRDLELRGAGNLLGAEQHGHMEAVGYDLYCKMLNEAVQEAKGIEVQDDFETTIDMNIDAYIPEKYIPNEYLKLDIYKRIAGIENAEEYEDMQEELLDRFGEPPKMVQNLLAIANLKAMAHRIYLTEVKQMGEQLRLTMYEKAKVDPTKLPQIIAKHPEELKFKVESNPYFLYTPRKRKAKEVIPMMEKAMELLSEMQCIVVNENEDLAGNNVKKL
ncbi:MAG: transcription-repair coupling factor [Clostridia bacterium]|nr:transcription-repair coupling factor [Clostridia bacterium]NCC42084.1 transcription-repair coupling factor [Clostridia bacterium]